MATSGQQPKSPFKVSATTFLESEHNYCLNSQNAAFTLTAFQIEGKEEGIKKQGKKTSNAKYSFFNPRKQRGKNEFELTALCMY